MPRIEKRARVEYRITLSRQKPAEAVRFRRTFIEAIFIEQMILLRGMHRASFARAVDDFRFWLLRIEGSNGDLLSLHEPIQLFKQAVAETTKLWKPVSRFLVMILSLETEDICR
jgi:predicted small integral membrane protein